MPSMTIGLICATLAAGAAAQTALPPLPTEQQLREHCSFEAAGIRECLQDKLSQSDAALSRAEAAAASAIDRWDTEQKFSQQARRRLADAATAFVAYRARQCNFAATLGGSAIGHALEVRRLACATELNLARAQALNALTAELPAR